MKLSYGTSTFIIPLFRALFSVFILLYPSWSQFLWLMERSCFVCGLVVTLTAREHAPLISPCPWAGQPLIPTAAIRYMNLIATYACELLCILITDYITWCCHPWCRQYWCGCGYGWDLSSCLSNKWPCQWSVFPLAIPQPHLSPAARRDSGYGGGVFGQLRHSVFHWKGSVWLCEISSKQTRGNAGEYASVQVVDVSCVVRIRGWRYSHDMMVYVCRDAC